MGDEDDGPHDLDDFATHSNTHLSPSNVRAKRAKWMTRTSDILGQFTKTDIDSYLSLIRRKVQEKCNTIQDLMQHIRMNKINNGNHVTPNEFRYTLIKFGVILAQPLVDNIFRVFDTDRSGTMDFDEFAMWIMNSEFQPEIMDLHPGKAKHLSPDEILRSKLQKAINKFPQVFKVMKKRVNFMELVSDANRFDMGLTERDVRSIFLKFDIKDEGFIDSHKFKAWAETGVVPKTPSTADRHARLVKTAVRPDIKKSVFDICGRSTNLISDCFSHFPRGENVIIDFDEFRRCLLSRGLSKPKETKALFFALGGEPGGRGTVNVDKLLDYLPSKESILQNSGTAPSFKMPQRDLVPVSRADRALREALRKRYKFIKGLFDRADYEGRGYLPVHTIYNIINEHVLPLSYQDFRHIMKNVMQDEKQNLSYLHMLTMYNPMRAPHILDGSTSTAKSASEQVLMAITSVEKNDTNTASAVIDPDHDDYEEVPATTSTSGSVDVRRNWQSVLRLCQKEDPKRTGLVFREIFLDAVSKTGLKNNFGASHLSEIADQFTVRDGQVDYLSCFRTYLNGIVQKLPPADSPSKFSKSRSNVRRETDGNHPWDYGYAKDRESHQPYWLNSTLPKSEGDLRFKDGTHIHGPNGNPVSDSLTLRKRGDIMAAVTMNTTKQLNSLGNESVSDAARVGMLRGLPSAVVGTCKKCNRIFLPIWRDLRTEFKRRQETNKRGVISVVNFNQILNDFGVRLAGTEVTALQKAFGKGTNGGVKFDDFMRICLVSTADVCRAAGM
jgi:Ca2+-binding EF-hand superfamily protein